MLGAAYANDLPTRSVVTVPSPGRRASAPRMRRSTDAPSIDVVTAMVINERNNGERRCRKVGRAMKARKRNARSGTRLGTAVTPKMTPT